MPLSKIRYSAGNSMPRLGNFTDLSKSMQFDTLTAVTSSTNANVDHQITFK